MQRLIYLLWHRVCRMRCVQRDPRGSLLKFFSEIHVDYDPERAAQYKTHSEVLVYRELPLSVLVRFLIPRPDGELT